MSHHVIQVESQVSVLTEQMTVLLAYLGTIQAAALSTDERGRRVGSDVSLDFFASSTISPTRAMVRSGFLSLMLEIHN